jgi:hypothetical protein
VVPSLVSAFVLSQHAQAGFSGDAFPSCGTVDVWFAVWPHDVTVKISAKAISLHFIIQVS